MDIGFWLRVAGGIGAIAVALAILGPWLLAVAAKFWPGAASGVPGAIARQVTAKAAIAVVWSAIQTIVGVAYAQGDKETADDALMLLLKVHAWDDVKPPPAPVASGEPPPAPAPTVDLAAMQAQLAAITAKLEAKP